MSSAPSNEREERPSFLGDLGQGENEVRALLMNAGYLNIIIFFFCIAAWPVFRTHVPAPIIVSTVELF
jgi:hypothetical protein